MKIKKVEIEAFRAYDKVEDGTFDFEIAPNDIADFVSICAPNGFGKTSFYDAVEWVYTNKIVRLDKNRHFSKMAKSERSENSEKQYILRNRNSAKKVGTVRLTTDLKSTPFVRSTKLIKRKGQSDYQFEAQPLAKGRGKFQEVLLSQEWINAFLREDDPQTRYEKFIDAFGEADLEADYRTIRKLIKLNSSEIEAINSQIKGLNIVLSEKLDEKLLFKINDTISKYNKIEPSLPEITITTSENDFVTFSNLLTELSRKIENTIISQKEVKKEISLIETGNENQIGVDGYFNKKKELIQLQNELLSFKKIKMKFEEVQEITNQSENFFKRKKELQKLQDDLKLLIIKFEKYDAIKKSIANENEKIIENEKFIANKYNENTNQMKELSETEVQLKTQKIKFQSDEKRMNELPKKIKKLDELNKELIEVKNKNNDLQKELKLKQKAEQDHNYKKIELQPIIENLRNRSFYLLPDDYKKDHKKDIKILEMLLVKNIEIEEEQKKIETVFKRTESLKKDYSDLIQLGLKIVDNDELTSCPLCAQKYNDFAELSNKISCNSLLEENLKEVLDSKKELKKNADGINAEISNLITVLINPMEAIVSDKLALKKINLKEIQGININILKCHEQIKNIEHKLIITKQECPELVKEKPQLFLQDSLFKLGEKIENLSKKVSIQTELIQKNKEKIEQFQALVQISKKTIKNHLKNEDYNSLVKYKNNNLIKKDELELSDIESHIQKIENEIIKYENEQKKWTARTETLRKELFKFNEDKVVEELKNSTNKSETNERLIKYYQAKVKEQINVSFDKITMSKFKEIIKEKKEEVNKNIEIAKLKSSLLEPISGYKENVLPFLKYVKAKEEKIKLEKEKVFLIEKVGYSLSKERKKLEVHIKKIVDSFFYQDLINTLYHKIDPHPDYKEISFKCEFPSNSNEKPKLNVFVSDTSENHHIPSLYFSAAQQNILCLSIFLAKALHATDEKGNPINCILIDDPIQSMDSINVLSTIDLFRSIVVKMNKQIILSTHDSNFQNLLKKRYQPPNLEQNTLSWNLLEKLLWRIEIIFQPKNAPDFIGDFGVVQQIG